MYIPPGISPEFEDRSSIMAPSSLTRYIMCPVLWFPPKSKIYPLNETPASYKFFTRDLSF